MRPMRPVRLDEHEITVRLAGVPGWRREGDLLRRSVELASFADAIAFVTRVGFLAEAADHHPDIDIRWRRVDLVLTTHDADGITAADFDLAGHIDAAAWAFGAGGGAEG